MDLLVDITWVRSCFQMAMAYLGHAPNGGVAVEGI